MIPIIYDPSIALPILSVGIPAVIIAAIWKHFKPSES